MRTYLLTLDGDLYPSRTITIPFASESDRAAIRDAQAHARHVRRTYGGGLDRVAVYALRIGRFDPSTGAFATRADRRVYDSDEDGWLPRVEGRGAAGASGAAGAPLASAPASPLGGSGSASASAIVLELPTAPWQLPDGTYEWTTAGPPPVVAEAVQDEPVGRNGNGESRCDGDGEPDTPLVIRVDGRGRTTPMDVEIAVHAAAIELDCGAYEVRARLAGGRAVETPRAEDEGGMAVLRFVVGAGERECVGVRGEC